MAEIAFGFTSIPILYLIIVYLTPLQFNMNLFLVFCGVTAMFIILDTIRSAVKR
jgi:hypothetical protein